MPAPEPDQNEQQALQDALAGLLAPVARLAVARGLPYPAVEDMLKRAFVNAADLAHPGLLAHRKASRISTSTGINRREVTRLVQAKAPGAVPVPPGQRAARGRSLASEVFAHWRTQRPYRDRSGQPRVLPRLGPSPSFETLAQAITRDVHPRSLLDELCRLGLAAWDEDADTVRLERDAFVPQGDRVRMLGLLGDNVGDHLRAAVDNVLQGDRSHFEQALFADGLSAASLAAVRPQVRALWQGVLAALVPLLEASIEADAKAGPLATPPQGRLRVGLFSYHEGAEPPAAPPPAAPRLARKKPPRGPR